MDKYTIYCTETQAKKARELGAPIEHAKISEISYTNGIEICDNNEEVLYNTPTAEQLIGWLDEQGLVVSIRPNYADYHWDVWKSSCIIDMSETETISSRKEATLAAIDAALEYLKNNIK